MVVVYVKYFIPIVLIVICFGGPYELISMKTPESVLILIVLALILAVSSLILTFVPAKTKDCFETNKRIK